MKSKDIVFTASRNGKLLELVRSELKGVPTGKTKSYLEHGCISVDGTVSTKYDYAVKVGQTVKIGQHGNFGAKSLIPVIYEDEALIAVNKPAGLLSVATDTEKENTAYRMLKQGREGSLFVVHRLDKDTSGVLLFAKSSAVRDKLQENWTDTPRREYIAICQGIFEEKQGRIETQLRESSTHFVYSAQSGGQRAVTYYEVIKENRSWSLLRVLLETGKKNQIRVHFSELGHPVAGDKKYGFRGNGMNRLMLHASELEIVHPVSGKHVTIKAPLPVGFKLPRV